MKKLLMCFFLMVALPVLAEVQATIINRSNSEILVFNAADVMSYKNLAVGVLGWKLLPNERKSFSSINGNFIIQFDSGREQMPAGLMKLDISPKEFFKADDKDHIIEFQVDNSFPLYIIYGEKIEEEFTMLRNVDFEKHRWSRTVEAAQLFYKQYSRMSLK